MKVPGLASEKGGISMSRPIVRSLAAILTLAAVLCVAAPAAAAPASRSLPHAVSGPSLVDQFLAWLGSLWLGHVPQMQAPAAKTGDPTGGGGQKGTGLFYNPEIDGSGVFDPNG
jgi:hypothetical protein